MSRGPAADGQRPWPASSALAPRVPPGWSVACVGERGWSALLAVCALASVIPLYAGRHLPMSDGPEHIATIATLRHYWDPAWRGQEYFALASPWSTQYWLYDALGACLAWALGGAERANLALLTAGGLGFTYGPAYLLTTLGRDRRLAILGSPLFWSQALTVGLVNYVVSIPVLLVGLGLTIRHAQRPSWRSGVALTAVATINLYLHLSTFILLVATGGLTTLVLGWPQLQPSRWSPSTRRTTAGALWARTWWSIPPGLAAACMVMWRMEHPESGGTHFGSRLALCASWLHWCFDVWRDGGGAWGGGAVVACALIVAASTASAKVAKVSGLPRHLAPTLVLVVVGLWLAMPSSSGDYTFLLDVRLAPVVALFALLLIKPGGGRVAETALLVGSVLAVGLGIHGATQVWAFNRDEVGNFDAILTRMPAGARLLYLNLAPRSQIATSDPFGYFGAYYRARYGGITAFSFSEIPHWPVHYRAAWRPPGGLSWGSPCGFRNETAGEFFQYVMVHGDRNPLTAKGPVWQVVGGSRAWTLYRRVEGTWNDGNGLPDAGPCAVP